MADFWYDPRERWTFRAVFDGIRRTFTNFASEAAAKQGYELQRGQSEKGLPLYDQRELRQLGLCGTSQSYDEALVRRKNAFGIVNEDGSIIRLVGGRRGV